VACGDVGGRSPAMRTVSCPMAASLLARLRLRRAWGATSSGW
jgi:hypothetical protein